MTWIISWNNYVKCDPGYLIHLAASCWCHQLSALNRALKYFRQSACNWHQTTNLPVLNHLTVKWQHTQIHTHILYTNTSTYTYIYTCTHTHTHTHIIYICIYTHTLLSLNLRERIHTSYKHVQMVESCDGGCQMAFGVVQLFDITGDLFHLQPSSILKFYRVTVQSCYLPDKYCLF